MEFKGTPGPWEFRKWNGDKWPEKRWSVGESSHLGRCVCISPRYEFETKESEANAQLISKSPQMAENMQMHIDALDLTNLEFYEKYGFNVSELIPRTRKLIKEATES